jgi:Flp pilus assembly protein TadG
MRLQHNGVRSRPRHAPNGCERQREHGITAVETAMVLPLLLLFFIGILEFSLLMTSRANMKAAVNAAVRAGSVASNAPEADYLILSEINKYLSNRVESVDYVIIFNANSAIGSQPPAACLQAAKSGGTGSAADKCNIYYRSTLAAPVAATFGYDALTNATAIADKFWPAKSRSATYSGGRDLLGVYIGSKSKSVTGLVPETSMKSVSILRIEAQDV